MTEKDGKSNRNGGGKMKKAGEIEGVEVPNAS
jgi:hypothetical protein